MQINDTLLALDEDIKDNLFRVIDYTAMFTNNNYECIRKRQQGEVLCSINNNLAKCVTSLNKDLTTLDR